ncbi:MAG TPA: ABC transporter permease subunit, partial [Candidatus Thermoplasmatota archaeon]|nr:ABC transporter permease subunit [Candidatus Thermoplasmatota archaeon]
MSPAGAPAPAAAAPVASALAAHAQEARMSGRHPLPGLGRQVYEVARKEVLQHVRTKRLLIIAPVFLLALVFVTLVVPLAFFERSDLQELNTEFPVSVQNAVMLFFLSGFFFLSGYFYVQLVPILLTADAVCSEWSNRSIFLLLSKPVSRVAFVLGKWAGSVTTVAIALGGVLLLDYLILQVALPGFSDGEDWLRFLGALGIFLLGGMAFASMALFWSAATRSTVVANLLAIVTWIIILPLLSALGVILAGLRGGGRAIAESNTEWSQYLSP